MFYYFEIRNGEKRSQIPYFLCIFYTLGKKNWTQIKLPRPLGANGPRVYTLVHHLSRVRTPVSTEMGRCPQNSTAPCLKPVSAACLDEVSLDLR